jgi:hypothetical protein
MTSAEGTLCVGQVVCSTSGKRLGTIGSLSGRRFLLRGQAESVWLSRDCVFTIVAGRVTLICEESGLHRYSPV